MRLCCYLIKQAWFTQHERQEEHYLLCSCVYRFSESNVKVNVAGKVGEMFDSRKNHNQVGVASGDVSDEKVNNSLSFAFGEDVASHKTSIAEKA